jgi:hypothetical protein
MRGGSSRIGCGARGAVLNSGSKVVIESRTLAGSPSGQHLQLVATVYIDGSEYRVFAPPKAVAEPLEWVQHFSVQTPSPDGFGEIEPSGSVRMLAIKLVKEELEKRHRPAEILADTLAGPFYHVRLHVLDKPEFEVKLDLSRDELEERVLVPYRDLRPIVLNGRTMLIESIGRIEIFEGTSPSSQLEPLTLSLGRQGVHDWFYGEPSVKDVTNELIITPGVAFLPQKTDAVELLCSRFHTVTRQLRERHSNRPTLDVTDEYDVQDLLHALLRIFFDDVRPEAWTPNYAGKSSRMDFLLPAEQLVIEAKKTRPGLAAKEIGTQLIDDISRYRQHPQCKRLICFVYDPDGRVANPRGLERDLSRNEAGLEVQVLVVPRTD